MPGRIFVTGASGFVGSAVVDELIRRNYQVKALSHNRTLPAAAVDAMHGSIFDHDVLEDGIRGCDAVIHLVGIIFERPSKGITFQRVHFEGVKNVVDAAKRAGVKRYVHMSALGTRPDAVSEYHKTKYAAEEYVRASGLEWTIIRPSMIHGPKGEFMQIAAKWARGTAPPFLFMPYFGAGAFGEGGAGLLQPVYVNDVARAFVDSVENRRTIGEIYLLGGMQKLTWPQLHKSISSHVVGKARLALPMPVWQAKLFAAIGVGGLLGFNRDQVIMSQEDNTCDLSKFKETFGWTPLAFEEALKNYAGAL